MPRPGLLQRLRRRPATGVLPVRIAWDERLAAALADLLGCRHGARARPGLAAAAHAARDLGDDAALRGLCDAVVRGLAGIDPRFTRLQATLLSRDDAGLVRLLVEARLGDGEAASCVVRLSPRLPPEVHRVS
ncbi:hypothetical protein [Nannocystis sp. SCPEA4]|uniref:hypothetical protein n=1 Tax=Nannocystis sp. SCPEA4 TaxID=2996787 RepID=UPI00226F2617|nr:hypothetical protein [Nannocystis sp. SCPEA4]MCY1060203.1 hypothetical protein [Nannocystis sp. SCPEA4]